MADSKIALALRALVFTQGFGTPLRSESSQMPRLVLFRHCEITGSLLCENIPARSHQPSIVATRPAAPNTNTRAINEMRTDLSNNNQGNSSVQETSRIFVGCSGMAIFMG